MHDPLTVAFEIPRPWPEGANWRTEHAARTNTRWQIRPFWVLAGRGLRWPTVVTVWHRDPSGYDSTSCPIPGRAWRFHVHHWRLQVHPLQHWRRRLLTRCAWCHGRDRKGDPVCVSHAWDGPRGHWWQGERGLFHSDCLSVKQAHATCTCKRPVLEHGDYGRCAQCTRYRAFGATPERLARARQLAALPQGSRLRGAPKAG